MNANILVSDMSQRNKFSQCTDHAESTVGQHVIQLEFNSLVSHILG